MFNYFTIAGVDSRDFGVYISGHLTFGSPERSYDEYEIPGRNGILLGSNKRFSNAEYGYKCAIVGDFESNMAEFRTFLNSLDGYQRLEDSYHPDEYRMAVLMESINPDMTPDNEQGEFDVIFSCLPQRFLKSGESEYTVGGGTISGNPIYTDLSAVDADSITVTIDQPYENASKELTPTPAYQQVTYLTFEVNGTPVWSKQLPDNVIKGTFSQKTGGTITRIKKYLPKTGWIKDEDYSSRYYVPFAPGGVILACDTFTYKPTGLHVVGECWLENGNFYCTAGAQYDTVEKFEAWVNSFAQYGIRWSVVVATMIQATWSDSALALPAEWGTLSTPYGQISLDVTATDTLVNPTRFASKPLIRLYGNGTATINGQTITVSNSVSYVDIDCDMMDCYEGSTNRNADVVFSTYDFPELVPGDNTFIAGTGITGFVVTPRWWRV